jgi:hypothetical protein
MKQTKTCRFQRRQVRLTALAAAEFHRRSVTVFQPFAASPRMIDSQNRLLTRAVQKAFPNRDRKGAAYANSRNLVPARNSHTCCGDVAQALVRAALAPAALAPAALAPAALAPAASRLFSTRRSHVDSVSVLVPSCESSRMPLPYGRGSVNPSEPRALASGLENRPHAGFCHLVLGVARSGDAVRTSACATSSPTNVCEKCRPAAPRRHISQQRRADSTELRRGKATWRF